MSFGTDPLNPDTDGDGLLDGTEVDMAMGSGCPDPTLADSDGDSLSDSEEQTLGTSPCSADTDGDGVPDDVDDEPLTPGVSSGFIEDELRALAADVASIPLASFTGPNANAQRGRRTAMRVALYVAARQVARGRNGVATIIVEGVLLPRVDGASPPRDWMEPGPDRDGLANDLATLAYLLSFE